MPTRYNKVFIFLMSYNVDAFILCIVQKSEYTFINGIAETFLFLKNSFLDLFFSSNAKSTNMTNIKKVEIINSIHSVSSILLSLSDERTH